MSCTIRDATTADLPAIERLTLDAYSEFAAVMTASAWAGLDGAVRAALATAQPVQRVIAENNGVIVGSVMLFPPAADAYDGAAAQVGWPELRLLAVSSAARGLGVGRALVEECMRRAREMGAHEIGLHTSESMRAATQLYTRLGFVRAPEYDFRPPGAELVKAYRLPLCARDDASA